MVPLSASLPVLMTVFVAVAEEFAVADG